MKRNNTVDNSVIAVDNNKIKPIIRKDSHLKLFYPSQTLYKVKVNEKDKRLELTGIPKGLIDSLQNAGFTVEKILDNQPSQIAEILGIDGYEGEIIYQEARKAFTNSEDIKFK